MSDYQTLPETIRAEIRALLHHFAQGNVHTPRAINGNCECAFFDCDCDVMTLTVACNNDASEWDYQTGDNSYTGGAYFYEHWAVVNIATDFDIDETLTDIADQLENSLAEIISTGTGYSL